MKTNSTVTRRDALKNIVAGSLAVGTPVVLMPRLAMPVAASEHSTSNQVNEATEFIPENDYPFFGWHPEALLTQP